MKRQTRTIKSVVIFTLILLVTLAVNVYTPMLYKAQTDSEISSLLDVENLLGIKEWREKGYFGQGVSIGVIDLGFGGIKDFEANFVDVIVRHEDEAEAYNTDASRHGVRVLEIIHTIAPEAKLYACRYLRYQEYEACLTWMSREGVRIINHSAGVPIYPADGSSKWTATTENEVQNHNILWINAAGNFGSGFALIDFLDLDNDGYHNFRHDGNKNAFHFEVGDTVGHNLFITWRKQNGHLANTINLSLEVTVPNGCDPVEIIPYSDQDYAFERAFLQCKGSYEISIRNLDSEKDNITFAIWAEALSLPDSLTKSLASPVIAPGDAKHILTVGALENLSHLYVYSSKGTQRDDQSVKPDIVAPAKIQMHDGSTFWGTSAASAVVAGTAALLYQSDQTLNYQELLQELYDRAHDIGRLGVDNEFGYGLVFLKDAPVATAETFIYQPPHPTLDETEIATLIPADMTPHAIANKEIVNLRSGPGTKYGVVAKVSQNAVLPIIAQADDHRWLLVDASAYIAAADKMAWVFSGVIQLNDAAMTATFIPAETIPVVPTDSATITPIWTQSVLGGGSGIDIPLEPTKTVTKTNSPTPTATHTPTSTDTPTFTPDVTPSATAATPLPATNFYMIPKNGVVYASSSANVRHGPSVRAEIAYTLEAGTIIDIQGEIFNEEWTWYFIGSGYLREDLVEYFGNRQTVQAMLTELALTRNAVPPTSTYTPTMDVPYPPVETATFPPGVTPIR